MDKETKTNYFAEWFNAVPARWRTMLAELIALVGATAALVVWLIGKGLAWYWIILYVLVVFVFAFLSYSSYRKVALERDKQTKEAKESKEAEKALRIQLDEEKANVRTLREQLLKRSMPIGNAGIVIDGNAKPTIMGGQAHGGRGGAGTIIRGNAQPNISGLQSFGGSQVPAEDSKIKKLDSGKEDSQS